MKDSPFSYDGSWALVVLESVNWYNFCLAATPFMDTLSPRMVRTCASWTVPSFRAMRAGILPNLDSRDEARWWVSKGVGERPYDVPRLAQKAGYHTYGLFGFENVTEPEGFDDFAVLAEEDALRKAETFERPFFAMVHLARTHMPYDLPGDPTERMRPAQYQAYNEGDASVVPKAHLRYLRSRQVACIEHADEAVRHLCETLADSHVIIIADHGDLFGEVGRYGHTYWFHKRLFEVPMMYDPPR